MSNLLFSLGFVGLVMLVIGMMFYVSGGDDSEMPSDIRRGRRTFIIWLMVLGISLTAIGLITAFARIFPELFLT